MFSKILALGAVVASVAAQTATSSATSYAVTQVQIDSAPFQYSYGTPAAIQYSSPDSTDPITITLMQGPTQNLLPVETLLVTQDGTDGTFTWDPSSSPKCLATSELYALQITQAGQPVNYWGHITITNAAGCDTGSSSSSSSSVASSTVSSSWGSSSAVSSPCPTSSATMPTWTPGWNTTTLVAVTSTTVPCNATTAMSSTWVPKPTSQPTGITPSNSGVRFGSSMAVVFGVFAAFVALN